MSKKLLGCLPCWKRQASEEEESRGFTESLLPVGGPPTTALFYENRSHSALSEEYHDALAEGFRASFFLSSILDKNRSDSALSEEYYDALGEGFRASFFLSSILDKNRSHSALSEEYYDALGEGFRASYFLSSILDKDGSSSEEYYDASETGDKEAIRGKTFGYIASQQTDTARNCFGAYAGAGGNYKQVLRNARGLFYSNEGFRASYFLSSILDKDRSSSEEYYDASETGDKEAIRNDFQSSTFMPPSELTIEEPPHRLKTEVDENVKKSLQIVLENVDHKWNLVHEDGDLKVYRRDYEEGDIVLEGVKATHIVQGVTAREMAHYFFDKDAYMDWGSNLESSKVLEQLSESSIIVHQIYKRVLLSSQRDTVFLSHIREIPSSDVGERVENEVGRPWIVCNKSVEHQNAPMNKYIRASIVMCLHCQTFIEPRAEGEKLTRDRATCKITFAANVNPGGWVPLRLLRTQSKLAYPKYLRKMSSFCQKAFKDKPIAM